MRDLPLLRRSPLAAAVFAVLHAASTAQAADPASAPQQMKKIAVQAEEESYKADDSASVRFTQPLRDTPQTITVISESLIREQGATTLRDVLRNSPGITFQAGEGGGGLPGDQNFTMRGFSSRNSLFIDGVRDGGAYTRDSFNLQRVEVIKGPAGSIAGRSAASGAINQITKTPQAGDSQDYSLGYGTEDFKRVTADVNLGIGDSLGLRLNAMYHDAEVSNRDVAENQRWGFAPSFAAELSDATRLTLAYSYLEEDNVPDYGLPWLSITQTTAGNAAHNGVFPTGAYDARPSVDQSVFYGLRHYDYEDIESQVATMQLDHAFSDAVRLRNVLRYLDTERSSAITAPRPPNRQLQRRDAGTENITNLTDFTLSFATGAIRHSLVAGVELARETTDNRSSANTANQPTVPDFFTPNPNQQPLGPMPVNTGNPSETRTDTVAVYAIDTIALSDQWQVAAGLRHDDAEIEYQSRNFITGASIDNLAKSESEVTWHAAVIFKPIEHGTLYISHGTGFDPTVDAGAVGPGLSTTPGSANNISYPPEESSNFELGTKWEFMQERLALNAAVFQMEKTNVRTRTGTGGNTEPHVLEGKQRVRGIELGASGLLTQAWSVFAGITYLDSEFKRSRNSLEDGQELLLTPDLSASLWTTYVLPRGVTVGFGAQYIDDVVRSRSATLGELVVPHYVLLDAMASYAVNERISLRLNATNLADEEYVDRLGGGHYVPGAGRTVSLTASFDF